MNSESHWTFHADERDRKRAAGAPRRLGRLPRRCLAVAAALVLAAAAPAADKTRPRDSLDLCQRPEVYALKVYGLALSPDGKNVAVFARTEKNDRDWDGKVTVWDVQSKKRHATLEEDGWYFGCPFGYTSDGSGLLVLGRRRVRDQEYRTSVAIWDAKTYVLSRTVDLDPDPDMREAVFTPDGKSLVVGTRSLRVQTYDVQTGKQTNALPCDEGHHVGDRWTMVLSADGRTLAVATGARNVFLFDVQNGKLLQKVYADSWIDVLALSPDGKTLVSFGGGGDDVGVVQMWDVATAKNIDALRTHSILGYPSGLAFSPDGKTVAMGAAGTVELWDIDKFGFRDDFHGNGNRGSVERLAFSADGKTLVTAGDRATVEFWDVPVGAPKSVRRDTTPPLVPPPGIVLPHR